MPRLERDYDLIATNKINSRSLPEFLGELVRLANPGAGRLEFAAFSVKKQRDENRG